MLTVTTDSGTRTAERRPLPLIAGAESTQETAFAGVAHLTGAALAQRMCDEPLPPHFNRQNRLASAGAELFAALLVLPSAPWASLIGSALGRRSRVSFSCARWLEDRLFERIGRLREQVSDARAGRFILYTMPLDTDDAYPLRAERVSEHSLRTINRLKALRFSPFEERVEYDDAERDQLF
jgi:hypothetical protein